MRRICRWLDRIRQSNHQGTHWPRWVTATDPAPTLPATPSWCYGTPGLARAQQLAAMALGDHDRKRMAERALLYCLTDMPQLDQLTDRGLCHGYGGLLRTVHRVSQDAETPRLFTERLAELSQHLLAADPPQEAGFLEGTAGADLALHSTRPDGGPATDWDACFLLS